jgi:uncharacterized delta-60 repeat protein
LYVIDANVEDLQTLLADLPEGSEALILDSSYDGVEQIANYVQGRSGIDALHVISHGSAGSVQLGSVLVDESYLVENAEYWERIGQALSDQGDILLYGCNVAQQQEGQLFMSRLAALTGADVAASTNPTGASAFGGDWVLEEQAGHIEATKLDSLSYNDVLEYNVVATPGKIILDWPGEEICFSVAVQSDGKILATGQFSGDLNLVRFNSNGTLDSSFDGDGIFQSDFGGCTFHDMEIQKDGKIVIGGSTGDRGAKNLALARFDINGSLDASFDGDTGIGNGKVITDFGYDDRSGGIALQNDGKIVASGDSNDNFILSRYHPCGKLDTSFGNSGKVITNFGGVEYAPKALVIQADGKIILAGATNIACNVDFALARYNTDGSLDTTFDGDGKVITGLAVVEDVLTDLILQKDGKILAVGLVGVSKSYDFALVRYNANGSLDTTFGQGGRVRTDFGYDDYARSVSLQADGKIVVAGRTLNGEEGDFALARYNPNGSLDTSFGVNGKVVTSFVRNTGYSCNKFEGANDVTVLPDGRILVAGETGGQDFALARYNPNGSLDTSFGVPVIKGTANHDTLVGTTGNDILQGLAGNDTITGGAGNDTLSGGAGNDSMVGGTGNDTYMVDSVGDQTLETSTLATAIDTVQSSITWTLGANLENLILTGTAAINGTGNGLNNKITGNSANNSLNGGSGNDTLVGGAGNDALNGSSGSDSMAGGTGNDSYYVNATGDIVTEAAGAGTDTVFSYLGAYTLGSNVEIGRIMSTSAANLTGNILNNALYAGVGNNVLQGGSGIDTVSYAYGVSGTTGVTVNLCVTTAQTTGGSGSDTLGGIENVAGSVNADRLTGNSGNNVLNGGAGNDTLLGGEGNDNLCGSTGNDSMTGGAGSDSFTFNSALGSSNIDIITDFVHGTDKIVLDDDIFAQIGAPGTLLAGAFRKGAGVTTAGDADDRIILNTTTGALYYDANGSAAGAAVHFATLSGTSTRAAITASDFLVVA